jgi:hypothetical protein
MEWVLVIILYNSGAAAIGHYPTKEACHNAAALGEIRYGDRSSGGGKVLPFTSAAAYACVPTSAGAPQR